MINSIFINMPFEDKPYIHTPGCEFLIISRFIEYVNNIKADKFYLSAVSEGLLCLRAMVKREGLLRENQFKQTGPPPNSNLVEYLNLAVSLLQNSYPKSEILLLGASIFLDLKKGVLLLKTMKQLHNLYPRNPLPRMIVSGFHFNQQEAGSSATFLKQIDLDSSVGEPLSLMDSIYYHGDIPESILESTMDLSLPYKEKFKLAMALSDIKYTIPAFANKIDEFIRNKLLIR